jgi:hypothetical protein
LFLVEALDGARRAIAEVKQHLQRLVIGWVIKKYYLELLRDSEGTLSRWLAAFALGRVVRYGSFSLCAIHMEGLSLNSVDIKRLLMMMY